LYESIRSHQTVVIRQISRNHAEQIAYYRYLENEQVTRSELVRSLSDHCQQQVDGRHILSISDTSEINLQSHQGRLNPEGLGVVGNNKDVGFFIHPTLAVDAATGFPLGLSNVQLWTRPSERPAKQERDHSKLPIEQKESYKWLASAERSQRCFEAGDARLVTHIGDRVSSAINAQPILLQGDLLHSQGMSQSDNLSVLPHQQKLVVSRKLSISPIKWKGFHPLRQLLS
jgi:hypothetical protein